VVDLKKVLVAVDFSTESVLAAKFAVSLAQKFNAKLFVLHVVTSMPSKIEPMVGSFDSIQTRVFVTAEAALQRVLPPEEKDTVDVEAIIDIGEPHNVIVERAKELGVDAIVIATRGLSGIAHVLLGSVAEKVTRHAPCPVFVIRDPMNKFDPA